MPTFTVANPDGSVTKHPNYGRPGAMRTASVAGSHRREASRVGASPQLDRRQGPERDAGDVSCFELVSTTSSRLAAGGGWCGYIDGLPSPVNSWLNMNMKVQQTLERDGAKALQVAAPMPVCDRCTRPHVLEDVLRRIFGRLTTSDGQRACMRKPTTGADCRESGDSGGQLSVHWRQDRLSSAAGNR
jgi:hypothetical protein